MELYTVLLQAEVNTDMSLILGTVGALLVMGAVAICVTVVVIVGVKKKKKGVRYTT